MLATSQLEIPRGEGWTYEPKWDGFRTIVALGEDGDVRLVSRDGRPLGRYFPEIVELVAERPPGTFVADGELIVIRPTGMEFDQLQLRLHPADEASFARRSRRVRNGSALRSSPASRNRSNRMSVAGISPDSFRTRESAGCKRSWS